MWPVRADRDQNLLAAAAYMNLIPLATRVLAEGHSPGKETDLFPPPVEAAALAGHAEMLDLLLQRVLTIDGQEKFCDLAAYRMYYPTIHNDIEPLKLVLTHSPRTASHLLHSEPLSHNIHHQWRSKDILQVLSRTTSPSIFWYSHELLTNHYHEPPSQQNLACYLRIHAGAGRAAMVETLIDIGASINSQRADKGTPLLAACRTGQESVVDLLLMQGVDPNRPSLRMISPLAVAAKRGNLPIVRKLLDRGADVNDGRLRGRRYSLLMAVSSEHVPLILLLLDKGASLQGHVFDRAMKLCDSLDLDSMKQLLYQYQEDTSDILP